MALTDLRIELEMLDSRITQMTQTLALMQYEHTVGKPVDENEMTHRLKSLLADCAEVHQRSIIISAMMGNESRQVGKIVDDLRRRVLGTSYYETEPMVHDTEDSRPYREVDEFTSADGDEPLRT